MRLTKRQLKRIIREEYSRLKRRGLIREMYEDPNVMEDNHAACVQDCLSAIPANMKQICSMGMGHMVINDVWHICKPICDDYGCDCDLVSEEVHETLCSM